MWVKDLAWFLNFLFAHKIWDMALKLQFECTINILYYISNFLSKIDTVNHTK